MKFVSRCEDFQGRLSQQFLILVSSVFPSWPLWLRFWFLVVAPPRYVLCGCFWYWFLVAAMLHCGKWFLVAATRNNRAKVAHCSVRFLRVKYLLCHPPTLISAHFILRTHAM